MKFVRFPVQVKPSFPQGNPRVYRLEVNYPSDPEVLERLAEEFGRWPRNRRYLTASGAEGRARLFRELGAEVTIRRSKPVEWE